MNWWMKNNLRTIQNNLRDLDADACKVDSYIAYLKKFHANTLLINCGGITSFYPTALPYQTKSPFLTGDFLGQLVSKCHENHIRVIGRFDFSRVSDTLIDEYPDWWWRDQEGKPYHFGDTVTTCVHSGYQQVLSSQIVKEVIEAYKIDGVFFNFFGYVPYDYSGTILDICQCENCRREYFKLYQEPLPLSIDGDPGLTHKYRHFMQMASARLLKCLHRTIKDISKEIALCLPLNDIPEGCMDLVDIIKTESNTQSMAHSMEAHWAYDTSRNVSVITDTFQDKIVSNISINALSLTCRFASSSPWENQIRLYQSIASGSGLDWCIIGNFEDYPNKRNYTAIEEVFAHHSRYERYYGHLKKNSKILLIGSGRTYPANPAQMGIFKMLKEEHLIFDHGDSRFLPLLAEKFDSYDFIIFTDEVSVTKAVQEALLQTSACVVAFKNTFCQSPELQRQLFDAEICQTVKNSDAVYACLLPEEAFAYPCSLNQQWIYVDQGYCSFTPLPGAKAMLPKIEKAPFGPPERAYGHVLTKEPLGVVSSKGNLYLAWDLGASYHKSGSPELKECFLCALSSIRPLFRELITNAPEMVEMHFGNCEESTYLLQWINLAGFNGTSFFAPPSLCKITASFTTIHPSEIYEMSSQGLKKLSFEKDTFEFNLDGLYKAFLIKT